MWNEIGRRVGFEGIPYGENTMKFLILLLPIMASLTPTLNSNSIHAFTVNDIRGRAVNLADYKGKVVLVVNTASKCGFTPQYKELQDLYARYSGKGLVIIGFPANDFMSQEPGSNEEIAEFCEVNYGVKFPMMAKVTVKGNEMHPLFRMLTSAENPDFKGDINWNFEKFLISPDGSLSRRFRSRVTPADSQLRAAIEGLLPK
jgi:glutathione peroxidase